MKGVLKAVHSVNCVNCGLLFTYETTGRSPRLCPDCKQKLLKPSRQPVARVDAAVEKKTTDEGLSKVELEELRKRLRWGGYGDLARIPKTKEFLAAFKARCERSLYMLARFVLGMPDLSEHLHHPVCDWLQDTAISRRKLLMLPVVHLKTSIGSHAFPIWALIQPASNNLLFKGMPGCDTRILLHGETTPKATENLSVIRQHLEGNHLLRHLWKDVFYTDPRRDAVANGGVWGEDRITVHRKRIGIAEPSITAIGVGTALEQRHYDLIIIDDIACFEAAHSEVVMNRAKDRRKSLFSRLNDITRSIMVGIGTHWTSQDVYVEWKKDPSFSIVIRAAIEDGKAIWPERHPLDALLALQEEEGMGKVLFSANYMNNPLNASFSALDWAEVRPYEIKNGFIVFDKDDADVRAADRMVAGGKFTSAYWTRRTEFQRGIGLDRLYPRKGWDDDESEEQHEQRLLARMERKVRAQDEGSATWVRLTELFARRREEAKQRGLLN